MGQKKKKSQGNLKIFELNENKNTTHGNAWGIA